MGSINFAPLHELWSYEPKKSSKKVNINKFEDVVYQKEYLEKNNQHITEKQPEPLIINETPYEEVPKTNDIVEENDIQSISLKIKDKWLIDLLSKYNPSYQSHIIEQTLKKGFLGGSQKYEFFGEEQIDMFKVLAILMILIAVYDIWSMSRSAF
jgi:hypothetical protein